MYAVTDLFLRTLRASHQVRIQVDAYRDGQLVLADLPIGGGSVTVDSGSQVRRTLSLTVSDPSLAPGTDPLAPLAPYGSELYVRRGIRYPNSSVEWVPLGWFRVESCSHTSGDQLQVTGADRSASVQDAKFTGTTASVTSNTIPAEITRLIQGGRSGTTVTDRTGNTSPTPSVFWEQDRWQAIQELAQSIGADVFFDPDGNAIIAPTPSITSAPVWWVDAGESGVLVSASTESTREGTFNGVVASGEAGGSWPPVSATVTDNDPASPTRWGGPFGYKPYFYVSPLITTQAQATAAATSLLAKVRAMGRQLSVSLVPNPALEVGDVVRVRFPDGSVETHLVDSFTVPLDPSSAMTITTRSDKPDLE